MKKNLAYFLIIFLFIGLLFLGSSTAFANNHLTPSNTGQNNNMTPSNTGQNDTFIPSNVGENNSSGIPNPLKAGNLILFIKQVVDQVLKFTEILAALLIIWSGFLFVKAQGDPAELETARRNFFYVIIGTAILLAAHVITDIIINTINQLR